MEGIGVGSIATVLGIVLIVISRFIISPTVSHVEEEVYQRNLFDVSGFILTFFGVITVIYSIRAKRVKTDDSKKS